MGRDHRLTTLVEQGHLDGTATDGLGRHFDLGLLAVEVERTEVGAPGVEVLLAGEHQRHGAVDARTGIPARTLLEVL